MTPGRYPSTKTSAFSTRLQTCAKPSGVFRSTMMLLFPRLTDSNTPGYMTRAESPFGGRSTFVTEAPSSSRFWVKNGPGSKDRKSTRLNSSHVKISYAVFCLKKKKKNNNRIHKSNATIE